MTILPKIIDPKKYRYLIGIILDIACLAIIFWSGTHMDKNLLSPITAPLPPFAHLTNDLNTLGSFSFAPSWSSRKLSQIDFGSNVTIAYYDLPVLADGTFDLENEGWITLQGDEALDLIRVAHSRGSKVLLTLSMTTDRGINSLLSSSDAQDTLIQGAIDEVKRVRADGVVIDFELNSPSTDNFKQGMNVFLSKFSTRMHTDVPGSQVTLAVKDSDADDNTYDFQTVTQSADKIFVIAYNFAVPEKQAGTFAAPMNGYNEDTYITDVKKSVLKFLSFVPEDKLVLETAWYGHGDNYPFNQTVAGDRRTKRPTASRNTMKTPLNQATITQLVSEVPHKARPAARKNLPYVAKALENEGILNENILAYALATIEHETAGTFEPIDEFKGRKNARRLGYEGSTKFHGRGLIQLTHLRNYKTMGERIGMGDALVKNPSLASDPNVAARVLAAFFKDNGVAMLADQGEFVQARIPVNPDEQGWWIAQLAWKYLSMLA